jgi:hypothetical protein
MATDVEKFTWYGEKGEPLRFADLTEAEQRVALIAAGGLIRGGNARKTQKLELPDTLPQAE